MGLELIISVEDGFRAEAATFTYYLYMPNLFLTLKGNEGRIHQFLVHSNFR